VVTSEAEGRTGTEISSEPVRLVHIRAADGRILEGLVYEPEGGRRAESSLLLLHGKGGNFYSGVNRFVPADLRRAGMATRCLVLNMRCHDLAYTRADVPFIDMPNGQPAVDGGMYEDFGAGLIDVAAGVEYLRAREDSPVVIGGHSSGGFYAALHAAVDDSIAGLALFSPLTSNRRPLAFWFPGAELDRALEEARNCVSSGRGNQLITVPTWFYAISAQALLERAEEPEDLWIKAMGSYKSPVLMTWGSSETRAVMWSELPAAFGSELVQTVEVPDAEHNYIGYEAEISKAMRDFIALIHERSWDEQVLDNIY
jgi:pimeloyl-ACP methyl ester carboxylesterase